MDLGPTKTPRDVWSSEDRDGSRVTVRYWAAARAAAGVSEECLTGATVAQVLAAARRAHADDPRFGQILDICTLLVGERRLTTSRLDEVDVGPGDVIDVLPPFAGG